MKISSGNHSVLRMLESDFAEFREQNPGKRRVPNSLREAVLTAISGGLKTSVITKSLGITGGQIAIWRGQVRPEAAIESPKEQLRVLNVTPNGLPGVRFSYEAGRMLFEFSL